MLAVVFVLAATLTLLPAVLGALGGKVNAAALPYARRQQHRSPVFARWGRILHKHPWPFAAVSLAILIGLAAPVFGLKTAMPSIAVVPADAPVRQGYELIQQQMGPGAPGTLSIITPAADAEITANTGRATSRAQAAARSGSPRSSPASSWRARSPWHRICNPL